MAISKKLIITASMLTAVAATGVGITATAATAAPQDTVTTSSVDGGSHSTPAKESAPSDDVRSPAWTQTTGDFSVSGAPGTSASDFEAATSH